MLDEEILSSVCSGRVKRKSFLAARGGGVVGCSIIDDIFYFILKFVLMETGCKL